MIARGPQPGNELRASAASVEKIRASSQETMRGENATGLRGD
jgi:hypothetical protein